jgi:hypothetical protein
MKTKKKLIPLSIFALAIGIATILPLTFFTLNTEATTQISADPWFNVDPCFAYFRVDLIDDGYRVTNMVNLQTSLNDKVLDRQSEARIEYFEFTFYTDNQQLLKSTYWVSMTKDNYKDTRNMYVIIRENMLNSSYLNTDQLSGIDIDILNDLTELEYTRSFGRVFGSKDDKFNDVLDAQTVYLDVSRVCYVTINNNTTTITWTSDQNIQHFELIKNGGAFTFGNTNTLDSYTNFDTWAQQASVDLPDASNDDIYVDVEAKLGHTAPR